LTIIARLRDVVRYIRDHWQSFHADIILETVPPCFPFRLLGAMQAPIATSLNRSSPDNLP
jgi:hypothetical protein